MHLTFTPKLIGRKRPLRISRGVAGDTTNLFLAVSHGGFTGIGEMAPVGYGTPQTAQFAEETLRRIAPSLEGLEPCEIFRVEQISREAEVGSSARSALDVACWDWLGKRAGLPLHQLLGLPPMSTRTDVTVGILPADEIHELVPELLGELDVRAIKVKLGGEDGIEHDKARFRAVVESAPPGTSLRADANGGWSLADAIEMTKFLAENGCEYIEQPLHFEQEDQFPALFEERALPIFYDESVATAVDAVRVAPFCDGINAKLMKSGGISEVLRIVAVARALGKKTMIGCFSESSVGIAAGVAIGSLFDYADLDSHFNLNPDPAEGLALEDGLLRTSGGPGLGVAMK